MTNPTEVFLVMHNSSDWECSSEEVIGVCLTKEEAEEKLLVFLAEQDRKKRRRNALQGQCAAAQRAFREKHAEREPLTKLEKKDKLRTIQYERLLQSDQVAREKARVELTKIVGPLNKEMYDLYVQDTEIDNYEIRPVKVGVLE